MKHRNILFVFAVLVMTAMMTLVGCDLLPGSGYDDDTDDGGSTTEETGRNWTNLDTTGSGAFSGTTTTIINNSTWPFEANIYDGNDRSRFIRSVEMNRKGDTYSFYAPATLVIDCAPIYVECTQYGSYMKANVVTENVVYILNK